MPNKQHNSYSHSTILIILLLLSNLLFFNCKVLSRDQQMSAFTAAVVVSILDKRQLGLCLPAVTGQQVANLLNYTANPLLTVTLVPVGRMGSESATSQHLRAV